MSDKTVPSQPFIYGRPVRPGEFLDREGELRTIFNRLRNCESTAVVGEPHIGKSSLLLQLADKATRQAYLANDDLCLVVSLLDLRPAGNDYTPMAFWEEALEPLRWIDDATLRQQLEQLAQAKYARRPLERTFHYLGSKRQQLVLLLDEFERLLIHPNFQDPAFFALLCSLATRTGGMVLITASRLSVAEMNNCGRNLLALCSPLFGNLIELRLQPFNQQAAEELLERASGVLSPHDLRFVRQVAGRHPFLLQAMAATLLEAEGRDRRKRAAERFYKRVSYHLDELWQMLDDRARTGMVILSLVELGGRAIGDKFKVKQDEIEERFIPELRHLEDLGLVEQTDAGPAEEEPTLLWAGQKWSVSTPIVVRWVHDVVIAEARQVPAYNEWLKDERYKFLLSQARWNSLIGEARNAFDWALKNGEPMMQLLYQVREWVT